MHRRHDRVRRGVFRRGALGVDDAPDKADRLRPRAAMRSITSTRPRPDVCRRRFPPTASPHRRRRTRRSPRRRLRRGSALPASIMDSSIWVATTTGLPALRAARVICFCRPGTASSGSSTPRSPRATISASASSRISCSYSSALGFSILASTPARPRTSFFTSATSSGRCTKDSAIQSTPSCQRRVEIGAVLGRHRRHGQQRIGHIDALAVLDLAAHFDMPLRPNPASTDQVRSRILPSSISRHAAA